MSHPTCLCVTIGCEERIYSAPHGTYLSSGVLPLIAFIRSVIREVAVHSSFASGRGAALCVGGDAGGDPAYILYDTKSILRDLTDIVGRAREDEATDVDDLVTKSFQSNILGFISLGGGCDGAREVKMSAARKGYGPLMYDIAMSVSPGGIMADRNNVTGAARGIWRKYLSLGSGVHGRVSAQKLDGAKCKLAKGEPALNYAYAAEAPLPLGPLQSSHASFLKRAHEILRLQGYKESAIEHRIWSAGSYFFDEAYMNSVEP